MMPKPKAPRSPWAQLELTGAVANDAPKVAPANETTLDDFLRDATRVSSAETRGDALGRHREQGTAARASGQVGEHWVEAHHARAVRQLGILACVWHVGAPSTPHVVGGRVQRDRRGRLLAAITDFAPPDYLGVMVDGRALVVEVKRRSGRLHRDRVRADGTEDRDAIEAHQARALTMTAATTALVLVVVEFVRARSVVRVAAPWSVVNQRWHAPRGGQPGVGPDELADWILPPDCDCYLALPRFAP